MRLVTPQETSQHSIHTGRDQGRHKDTIFSMSSDKVPGPDGFTGAFFKTCWDIIKDDITAAINSMFSLNSQGFDRLNSTNIILLPKKADAMRVTDFQPISLIHSITKIFAKLLANRLAPLLDSLVSKCQSAFIKKRSIHDNFLYVQNMVRTFQKQKLPAIFLKLDIHKAFDTVSWPYLLEVLQVIGFGPHWHEWVSILFRTTSLRVLLNGLQGPVFSHRRGSTRVTLCHPCCSYSPWIHCNDC
jgi:hypothetical protein